MMCIIMKVQIKTIITHENYKNGRCEFVVSEEKFADFELQENDKNLLRTEQEFYTSGKSIWGTSGCGRCGCCCYALEINEPDIIKPAYEICKNLKIDGGEAACSLHRDKKPEVCKTWTCYGGKGLGCYTQRALFTNLSVDVLKTKTTGDVQCLCETNIHSLYTSPLLYLL